MITLFRLDHRPTHGLDPVLGVLEDFRGVYTFHDRVIGLLNGVEQAEQAG